MTVKNLSSGGHIKTFREIFEPIPKTIVARDLGMNNVRFTDLMKNVQKFVVKDLFKLAALIEVDENVILTLIYNQYIADKAGKRKK